MAVITGTGPGQYVEIIDHVNNGEQASEEVFRRPSVLLENRTEALKDHTEALEVDHGLTKGRMDTAEAALLAEQGKVSALETSVGGLENNMAFMIDHTILEDGHQLVLDDSNVQKAILLKSLDGEGNATLADAIFADNGNLKDGTMVILIGLSDDETVTIPYSDTAKGCILNGECTLGRGQTLKLLYSGTQDRLFEISRNN